VSASTPISGEVLFDTNAASALIRQTSALMAALDPSCLVRLPLAAAGELLYGAHHAANTAAQLAKVRAFIGRVRVILPDQETAEMYGRIKAGLRLAGQMIPENDLWIAATALQLSLPLVTQDRHFTSVVGIQVVSW
jgi:tRNA(fMet)-specific endonuclease VapC